MKKLIVAFALLFSCLAPLNAEAEAIVTTGKGRSQEIAESYARFEALYDAAKDMATPTFFKEHTRNSMYLFFADYKPFVTRFDVVRSWKDGPLFWVEAKTEIDRPALAKELMRWNNVDDESLAMQRRVLKEAGAPKYEYDPDHGFDAICRAGNRGAVGETGRFELEVFRQKPIPSFKLVDIGGDSCLMWANKANKWGLINGSLDWVVKPRFDSVPNFDADGQAWVNENGKWGMIDRKLTWIIEPRLETTPDFKSTTKAWARQDGKWGLLSKTGAWIIAPRFAEAPIFDADDLAWASENGKSGIIDKTGSWVSKPRPGQGSWCFPGKMAKILNDGAWRLVDKSWNRISSSSFQDIRCFASHHSAWVNENGKWGVLDETGEWRVRPRFNQLQGFRLDDFARVRENDKWGLVNKSGAILVEPRLDYIKEFDPEPCMGCDPNARPVDLSPFGPDGLAIAKQQGKWGFIDKTGAWTIKPHFTDAYFFDEKGMAAAFESEKYGFINRSGEWVIKPIFDMTMMGLPEFSENGLAVAALRERGMGYIDRQGNWVIEPQFYWARPFGSRRFAIVAYFDQDKDGRHDEGAIDGTGALLLRWVETQSGRVYFNSEGEQIWPRDVK